MNTQEGPLRPSGTTLGGDFAGGWLPRASCGGTEPGQLDSLLFSGLSYTDRRAGLTEIWVTNLGACKHKVLWAIIKTRRGLTPLEVF